MSAEGRAVCAPVRPGWNSCRALALLWCLLLSALTVLKTAPEGLNADILLNTVMSLQKVTLYYWGQNRLLNVLPLLLAPVRDPAWNLALGLLLTAFCFYALLYALARVALRLLRISPLEPAALQLLVLLSLACVLSWRPRALGEMAIWHIEYSLSAWWLLLGVAAAMRRPLPWPPGWRAWLGQWPMGFWLALAIGLNPSALLPVGAIALGSWVWRRSWRLQEPAMLTFSLAAFLGWSWIASHFDSQSYGSFHLDTLRQGLPRVLDGLAETQRWPAALLCLMALLWAGWRLGGAAHEAHQRRLLAHAGPGVWLCSLGWLLLFSANQWVQANRFAWRYFSYPLLALVFLLALLAGACLARMKAAAAWCTTALAAAGVLALLAAPLRGFEDYEVFKKVNALTPAGGQLYAGDYWLVWPSVLRDMMAGHEAYGLVYRGSANAAQARAHVAHVLQRDGQVSVFCLNDRASTCTEAVQAIVGPLSLRDSLTRTDAVLELVFVAPAAPDGPG